MNGMKKNILNLETIPSADLTFEEFKAMLEDPIYEEDNINENGKIANDTEKNMTLVTIQTSLGELLELSDEKAPITVENFKTIAILVIMKEQYS